MSIRQNVIAKSKATKQSFKSGNCFISFAMTVLVLLILLSSCTKDKHPETNPYKTGCSDTLRYVYESSNSDLAIQPLISTNCAFGSGCHLQASGNLADTTYGNPRDLSNYTSVANSIRLGIFQYRILLPVSDPQHMPTQVEVQNHVSGIRLDNATLCKLLTWIEQGYPEK